MRPQQQAGLCIAPAGQVTSKRSQNLLDSSLFGCLLMMGYLGFDGFTSTWQDKMFKGFSMSIYNQILYVQLCSAGVSLVSLVMFGQVRREISAKVQWLQPDIWLLQLVLLLLRICAAGRVAPAALMHAMANTHTRACCSCIHNVLQACHGPDLLYNVVSANCVRADMTMNSRLLACS